MKYVFGTKINGTDETGIVNIEDRTILCLCTEEKATVILEALKISSNGMLAVTSDSKENKKESEVTFHRHRKSDGYKYMCSECGNGYDCGYCGCGRCK